MTQGSEPIEEEVVIEEDLIDLPTHPGRPSIAAIISTAVDQLMRLIKAEIALITAKAKAAAQKIGTGIGLLVVAAMLAFILLLWIFHSIELAFALFLPAWAAALVTTGLLLLIIGGCVFAGIALIKKGSAETPDVTAGVETDIHVVLEGLDK